jgi:flagellar basal body rod protein FlgB
MIFDKSFNALDTGMSIAAKKQAVIAHNISNADTPGFEALEFDEILGKVVKRTNRKVIIEEEMKNLAQNSLRYSSYVKLMSAKINILRTVITQGRK